MNNTDNVRKYTAKSLGLKDIYYELVISKRKISTIRFGFVFFNDITTLLTFSNNPSIDIKIKRIDYSKTFGDLNETDAKSDGYDSLDNLKTDIRKYYPTIENTSPMTIVYFDLIE